MVTGENMEKELECKLTLLKFTFKETDEILDLKIKTH